MNTCEVSIERSPFRFSDDVWLWQHTADGGTTVLAADGSWTWVQQGEAKPEPSFRIPEGYRECLAAALLGTAMPSDSMDRHLRDTITVRDRLLTLVERLTAGTYIERPTR